MTPQFSIVVPTYNQANYLVEALESLLAQTVTDWEAVVVDDGSTDQTPDVLARYAGRDARIRTFRQPNGGTAAALNRALAEVRGTWICWLSSDDRFVPEKLAIHRQWFERCPEVRFFFTYFQLHIEATGQLFGRHGLWGTLPQRRYQTLGLLQCNYISGISICVHRDVFAEVGGFSEELRYGQDYDCWLHITSRYPGVFIPEWTCVNRNHAGQGSEVFPQACYYDTAKAGIRFLQKTTFEGLFPLSDLANIAEAEEALHEALRIALDDDAFLYWLGATPALLFSAFDWIARCPDPITRRSFWHLAEERLETRLAVAPRNSFSHLCRVSHLAAQVMPGTVDRQGIEPIWAGRQIYTQLQATARSTVELQAYFDAYMNEPLTLTETPCAGMSVMLMGTSADGSWIEAWAQEGLRKGASVVLVHEGPASLRFTAGLNIMTVPPEQRSLVDRAAGHFDLVLHSQTASSGMPSPFSGTIDPGRPLSAVLASLAAQRAVPQQTPLSGLGRRLVTLVKQHFPLQYHQPLKRLLSHMQRHPQHFVQKGRQTLMTIKQHIITRLRQFCVSEQMANVLSFIVDKCCSENTAHAAFARRGLHLLRHHYYLPIPMADDLTPAFLESHSELVGIALDGPAMWELAETALRSYFSEFATFPTHRPEDAYQGFYLINGGYMAVDGHLYYSLVRHLKPRRIVETGCSMSSLLCSEALARNEAEGCAPCEYTCIEPYPQPYLVQNPRLKVSHFRTEKIQDTPLTVFESIESGDILFIDTTHALRMGGDVQQIYCEILPRLKPGVHVHIHDISLPRQYPRTYHEEALYYWSEQYLLQAYLTNNAKTRVHWAGNWLRLQDEQRFAALFPEFETMRHFFPQSEPTAFWFTTC